MLSDGRETVANIDRRGLAPDPKRAQQGEGDGLADKVQANRIPKTASNETRVTDTILNRDIAAVLLCAPGKDALAKNRDLRLQTVLPGTHVREFGLVPSQASTDFNTGISIIECPTLNTTPAAPVGAETQRPVNASTTVSARDLSFSRRGHAPFCAGCSHRGRGNRWGTLAGRSEKAKGEARKHG